MNVTFDSWLYEISVSIEAALECDQFAEVHLARIAGDLATGSTTDTSGGTFSSWVLPSTAAPTGRGARFAADLALEALVAATARGAEEVPSTSPDWQIISFCQQVRSVAEIAAHRGVPVGVARIVVGDLAEAGLLDVREPVRLDGTLGKYLLQRILRGLRQL